MNNRILKLVRAIARQGKRHPRPPVLGDVEAFKHFFRDDGALDAAALDARDGSCTRRELILRFLVLCAVIDQGPDMHGVRKLLVDVTNSLYRKEVRFLHTPISFFKELNISIDDVLASHAGIKKLRAKSWAEVNQTNPEKYNLFMDGTKQVLDYVVSRWGVPLALPLVLDKRAAEEHQATALLDYLEGYESAEAMSIGLKSNEQYGLGKAIGNKACHLFAKWMVSSFNLARNADKPWGDFSFEVPYDSNAGRVLWRTGYLLNWAREESYKNKQVIQTGAGKSGKHYIRVTNIRGMGAESDVSGDFKSRYDDVVINHLRINRKSPRKIQIQIIQHVYLLDMYDETGLSPADFDEGLMHIGVEYCFNHAEPNCAACPINKHCEGHNKNPGLIHDYRT
ncbi:MAG: hypothetical protein OXU62_05535 [Gammaproteobacteria bacterium]|nr:hypothetical protein [Gammaproteobacteria bacterium]